MAPLGEKDTGGGAHMSDTNDKIRIVQETVAGKEITFAHVIGGPAPIIYQKLGLNPAIDYGAAAIGIMNMTPPESAVIAADDLREAYPGRKIFVVDTLSASLGQGLLVYLCVQEKRKGKTIDQVHVFAEETKAKVCHWFTVDDLNHLKRGGRVSAAAALFGTMLAIKPVLHVDDTGHLVPVSKTRGRKASLLALVDRMAESAIDPAGQTIFISHGDCEADAEFVADEVRRRFGVQDIHINYVGPVIGNHSGPGTLALFFLGSRR